MPRTRFLQAGLIALSVLALFAARPADAQLSLSYTNIDVLHDPNDPNDIYGNGISSSGANISLSQYVYSTDIQHGYILSNGVYTRHDDPRTASGFYNYIGPVNSSGAYYGEYFNSTFTTDEPFVHTSGGVRSLLPQHPNSISTSYNGIGDNGKFAVAWQDSNNLGFASVYDPATQTFTDLPSKVLGYNTVARNFAPNGDVLVNYRDQNNARHGAIYNASSGIYSEIPDIPGGADPSYFGVNSSGLVLGEYTLGNRDYAFFYQNSVFTPIDAPDNRNLLMGFGVSESNQVVGSYLGADGYVHAFMVTVVPEPGSVALLVGLSVAGAGFLRRKTRKVRAC